MLLIVSDMKNTTSLIEFSCKQVTSEKRRNYGEVRVLKFRKSFFVCVVVDFIYGQ